MKSTNGKKMEAYNQMCVRLGLQPSSECEAFCGVVSGYDVVVSVPDRRYPCNFTVELPQKERCFWIRQCPRKS